ncbi:MAG: hypothetical protein ACRCXT_11180 [Paraclostridium sp.]
MKRNISLRMEQIITRAEAIEFLRDSDNYITLNYVKRLKGFTSKHKSYKKEFQRTLYNLCFKVSKDYRKTKVFTVNYIAF